LKHRELAGKRAEHRVGVFLDGIYLSRPGIALGDQLDVDSIEVLRGPQGTLFGRNVSAGALNLRTRRPSLTAQSGFLNLTAGNFNAFNLQAGVGGPLSDRVGYRLSAAVRNQDGFVESVSGAESYTRDRALVRGQLLWNFMDRGSLRIIGEDGQMLLEAPSYYQFSPVRVSAGPLQVSVGRKDSDRLQEVVIPSEHFSQLPVTEGHSAYNVARALTAFAEAIREGHRFRPDFQDGVDLHRLLDGVMASGEEGAWASCG